MSPRVTTKTEYTDGGRNSSHVGQSSFLFSEPLTDSIPVASIPVANVKFVFKYERASADFVVTDGGRSAAGYRESLDCTVRAAAVAGGISYAEAHAQLKSLGRRDGHTFAFGLLANEFVGAYRVRRNEFYSEYRTVGQFLKAKLTGRFVLRTNKHVFAVVDGVAFDLVKEGARRKVHCVWQFIPQTEARQ
jgi:hypothetical protein